MSSIHCVIGSAGHIDHGKTRLVEALTGTDCDRLAEEKRRGITIDIGFARLDFPGGLSAGIVDVPGHQRFIHNMVAGAAGIDIALLVVAADDGVMPQTIEHLALLDLLGVNLGVVALTKADLVDEETLKLAEADILELIEGSLLKGSRIIPCSTVTGEGIEKLRAELERLAAKIRPKPANAFFRMPVDRVFTIKGHGVVTTGTVFSGEARVGQKLALVPGGARLRVRRIQRHGETVESAMAGSRAALNLAGVEKRMIRRGMVICHPSIAHEYKMFTARIRCHESSPAAIVHGRSCLLHVHTFETSCRIHLVAEKGLKPGESCVGQIRFEEPVHLLWGDRFVLRSSSASHTLGGGMILEPGGPPLGRKGLKARTDKWSALGKKENGVAALVTEAPWGRRVDRIVEMFNMPEAELRSTLSRLEGVSVFEWRGVSYAYLLEEEKNIMKRVADAVSAFHENNPSLIGMEESQLALGPLEKMGARLAEYWIRRAVSAGVIEQKGALVRIPGRDVVFTGEDEAARARILEAFRKGGFAPPKTDKVHKSLGMRREEAARIIRALSQTGDLVPLAPDYTLSRDVLDEAKKKLVEEIESKGSVETGRYRDILGAGRKAAIDILEHFDGEGLTKRVDNKGKRVLRQKR